MTIKKRNASKSKKNRKYGITKNYTIAKRKRKYTKQPGPLFIPQDELNASIAEMRSLVAKEAELVMQQQSLCTSLKYLETSIKSTNIHLVDLIENLILREV